MKSKPGAWRVSFGLYARRLNAVMTMSNLQTHGVSTPTTGLNLTDAPSRLARTRTRGLIEERALEA